MTTQCVGGYQLIQNPKWLPKVKIPVLQVYFHKYCWNIVYLCHIKGFKIKIVDLYTHIAGGKELDEHIFKLFEDLVTMQVQTDRGSRK